MINKPTLPPKKGYVEIVDSNGNHVYKPTKETLEAENNKLIINELKEALELLANGGVE